MPHWLPLLPKIHLRDLSKTIVWIQQAIYFLVDQLQSAQCTLTALTLYHLPPQQTLLGVTQVLDQIGSCPKLSRTRYFLISLILTWPYLSTDLASCSTQVSPCSSIQLQLNCRHRLHTGWHFLP